jgi:hypothetical protein
MTRGSRQEVRVDTQPQGAAVRVNGNDYVSPVVLKLDRKQVYKVEVSAPGYETVQFDLKAQWDGMSIPSLILPLGTLWTAIDTADGCDKAFAKLEPVVLQTAKYPDSVLRLKEYRGKLLTDSQYAEAVQRERDQAAMNAAN